MNDFKPYAVFAEVVACGSMSAAARRLGMTPSAVSQIISGLERDFGVSLLYRSTRKIALTEAGERCYPHCVRLLEAGHAAAASLEQARDAPAGELRIAAPLGFGFHTAPALAPVLAEWPRLRLTLIVDDALIDLVESRIDIALRVGDLPDSNWVGRKLCDMDTVLCASPAYLARHGMPDSVADLARHHWLAHVRDIEEPTPPGAGLDEVPLPTFPLELMDAQANMERIMLHARTATTNQIALRQLCEQGMGIALLVYADVRPALEQGLLTRILPQIRLPSYPLTLLTGGRDREPAKVRVAMAALKSHFASLPRAPRARARVDK
ncbi:MAG: LysR family transcriptional regulator [Burkholderiales bacterium]|nr:LysR family transcriptional regulator [Burkholderiales bacterium]